MIQDEVESQLSAMFDGELPAAECELLSRRIDRDENLRGALVALCADRRRDALGAGGHGAQRLCHAASSAALVPVATARRRAPALAAAACFGARRWPATLVATVAGVVDFACCAMPPSVAAADAGRDAGRHAGARPTCARARAAVSAHDAACTGSGPGGVRRCSSGEPVSYVTPASMADRPVSAAHQLADYIVAHSEYSTPLMRRNLLSALVSSEDAADNASALRGCGRSAGELGAGACDASSAASASSH